MKIKTERECCNFSQGDLKEYRGIMDKSIKWATPRFCVHCGQIWYTTRECDAAGGTESVLKKHRLVELNCDEEA